MTGRIGCARSKCSAVSPFMSGAFPHYKSVITLLTNSVSKSTSVDVYILKYLLYIVRDYAVTSDNGKTSQL